MPLATFLLPSGQPNPDCVLQLASLLSAFWWSDVPNRTALLQALGGGTVVAQEVNTNSWPPGWIIYNIQGIYVIAINGTLTGSQFAAHVFGAVTPQNDTTLNCRVNGFWQTAWNNIKNSIRAALPNNLAGQVIYVTGHSYGSIIGLYEACALAQEAGIENVQFVGFGTPRGFGFPDPDGLPNRVIRIERTADIVCDMPPIWAGLTTAPFAAVSNLCVLAIWNHKGRAFELMDSGQLIETNQNWNALWAALDAEAPSIENHYMESYDDCIIALAKERGTAASTPAVIEILTNIISKTPPVTFVAPAIPPPSSTPEQLQDEYGNGINLGITSENISTVQLNTLRGFPVVYANLLNIGNLGESMAYSGYAKCQMIASDGRNGASLSLVAAVASNISLALGPSKLLMQKIANCFGTTGAGVPAYGNPAFTYVRISDALNPKLTQTYVLDPPICNQNITPTKLQTLNNDNISVAAGSAWDDVVFHQVGYSVGGTSVPDGRTFYLPWLPAQMISKYVINFGFANGQFASQIQALRQYLFNASQTQWGFMGHNPADGRFRIVASAAGLGNWTVNVLGNAPYQPGDKIRIELSRSKCFAQLWTVATTSLVLK